MRFPLQDTGGVLNKFTGHTNKECGVGSLVTHTDSEVVSGSEDGCVYIWDLVTAQISRKMDSVHKDVVYGLDAHPSKSVLLTAGVDGVKLWSSANESDQVDEKKEGGKLE